LKINTAISQGLNLAQYSRHPTKVNNPKRFFERGWEPAKEKITERQHTPFKKHIADMISGNINFVVALSGQKASYVRYAKLAGVEVSTAIIIGDKVKVFLKHGKFERFLNGSA